MWSLILKEENRVRLFENRVLVRCGPKRGNVTGGCRKLYKERFVICTLYHILGYHIKEAEIHGACRTYGLDEKYIQHFIQKI
jgi:hypothetical protein